MSRASLLAVTSHAAAHPLGGDLSNAEAVAAPGSADPAVNPGTSSRPRRRVRLSSPVTGVCRSRSAHGNVDAVDQAGDAPVMRLAGLSRAAWGTALLAAAPD